LQNFVDVFLQNRKIKNLKKIYKTRSEWAQNLAHGDHLLFNGAQASRRALAHSGPATLG
jgi:hypothetical protein